MSILRNSPAFTGTAREVKRSRDAQPQRHGVAGPNSPLRLCANLSALDQADRPQRPVAEPWAYFLTFTCYGERLHGDKRGTVDRHHNGAQTPYLSDNPDWRNFESKRMDQPRERLSEDARNVVLASIQAVSQHEGWTLYAAHIRSTHAHIVVSAPKKPEVVPGKPKAYSSRALNKAYGKRMKHWSRHGSTVYLWDARQLQSAVDYVVYGQGPAMSCYVNS